MKIFTTLSVLAATCLSAVALGNPAKAPQMIAQRMPLQAKHVPGVVLSGKARPVVATDINQRLRLTINLPLANPDELTRLLHDLYDPGSPQYRRYLSVEQFTERFAPSEVDYSTTVRWARANGFELIATQSNRRLVVVAAPVKTINAAFHVVMTNYQHPTEPRLFYSPDREPSLAGLKVPVLQITGLNNYVLPHATSHQSPTPIPNASGGSGPNGQFLPSDLRAAYYGKGPLTGAGQSIAILSLNGYLDSDLTLFFSKTGFSPPHAVKNVLVNGFSGACAPSPCDDSEQILDIGNALGIAPDAQILFYEGDRSEVLNQMATDNKAKVISSSWVWGTTEVPSDDAIFLEFQAQGQTYFNSSGDCGAYNDGECAATTTGGVDISYRNPGADPNITVVGGTSLTTSGAGGSWAGETGWSEGGGGYVSGIAIPSWQTLPGVITPSNYGSPVFRNSPDIAAEADFDNVTVKNGAYLSSFGGTSFAAPRWAGFIALVNQQAAEDGQASVGFLAPLLYHLGTVSSYSAIFHDVTSGCNPPIAGVGPGFCAGSGYDLVTGWGSPNGVATINALVPKPNCAALSELILSLRKQFDWLEQRRTSPLCAGPASWLCVQQIKTVQGELGEATQTAEKDHCPIPPN